MFFNPPAIPGMGSTGGFQMMLQDRAAGPPEDLAEVAGQVVAAARKRPEIGQVYALFSAEHAPPTSWRVDRDKCKKLGVPVNDVFVALQSFLGGVQINDFSRFGRTFKVTMQAEPEYRSDIRDIALLPRARAPRGTWSRSTPS